MINSDDIQNNGLSWCCIDTMPQWLKLEVPFVMNTCLSDQAGIHWVACCLIKERGTPTLYLYDSLGKDNLRPNDRLMKQTLKDKGIELYLHDDKAQFDTSVWCGWFAIFICKMMQQLPYLSIGTINNMITKHFGGDKKATRRDEEVIIRAFGLQGGDTEALLKEIKEGGGFFDSLGSHLRGLVLALKGTRNNLNPSIRKILAKIGDKPIQRMRVGRTPIVQTFNYVLKFINFIGKHKPSGVIHDKLFHLYMIITIDGLDWRFEKNQSINLVAYSPEKLEEVMDIPPSHQSGITLNQMIGQTIKGVGEVQYFHYASTSSNCQKFVFDNLTCGKFPLDKKEMEFIVQPVGDIIPLWGKKIGIAVTDIANRAELAIQGAGV